MTTHTGRWMVTTFRDTSAPPTGGSDTVPCFRLHRLLRAELCAPPLAELHFWPLLCRRQDDPAGAGLSTHQGKGGGWLSRRRAGVPLRSGARCGRWPRRAGAGGRRRAGPGLAVCVSRAKGASLSLPPTVHPVLGPAGGDDLRQEAIR